MTNDYISRKAILGYLFNDIWLTTMPTDATSAEDRQLAICRCMGLQEAMEAVKEFPAADVVEAVRCRDCRYRAADCFCTGRGWSMQLVADDGFCEKGKSKDGGQNDG